MRTPKRLLIWLAGMAAFLTSFEVYAYFLGAIDGLPPLPQAYSYETVADGDDLPPPVRETETDRKIRLAFNDNCSELQRVIKLEIPERGFVLVTDDAKPENGLVCLKPCSIAMFGKNHNGTFEINTIQCDMARLTFDRPLNNYQDMGNRKVVAGELIGNVKIENNRRTLQRDDDISLHIPGENARVYFDEAKHVIWTNDVVKLVDTQSKPQPTRINAWGMDVYLLAEKDNSASAPGARKKMENVAGVERIVLRSDVEMHLHVDSRSGFLGGKPAKPAKSLPAEPATATTPEKDHVVIKTQGPFRYDLQKDLAQFDVVPSTSRFPQRISVIWEQRQSGKVDQIDCDHLELQFRRKNKTPEAEKSGDRSVELEIESAHATGKEVVLTSDVEKLEAHGNDFFYDARTRESILKGEEITAAIDCNEIHARELRITDEKGAQQLTAIGPGRIDMFDKAVNRRSLHARWKDKLVSSKEGRLDCLIFTGEAVFEDDEHGQKLHADCLKVWLQPPEQGNGEPQRRRPSRLEAIGNVSARSVELNVNKPTDHLIIHFKDGPARSAPPTNPLLGQSPAPPLPGRGETAGPAGPLEPGKTRKPIDVGARSVEVHVLRTNNKNEMEKVWCEGKVVVHQDPVLNEDNGVDISGETLQLNHSPEGNHLVVCGNTAKVQMGKLSIHGPEVNIDQRTNRAWVNGQGAMQLPSGTNFHGDKLANPVDMTIHWNKDMFFNGKYALFHGGVQAEQDQARLLCEEMQVFLDRVVSLREGEKGKQPAKVEKLVCDKNVRLEDSAYDEEKLLRTYKRLTCSVMSLDNEEGVVNAHGPGVVHIIQAGQANGPFPGGNPRNAPPKEELKLTRVSFLDRLHAHNVKRTAIFYGNVEVVHVPTKNPDIEIDVDRPPPGCMQMRCKQLKVFSRKLPDGTTSQEMEAITNVEVQAQEFWGFAHTVKYDESKELVVFEGAEGSPATLYRVMKQGVQPDKVTGKKIFYWRRTNDIKIEGGSGIGIDSGR